MKTLVTCLLVALFTVCFAQADFNTQARHLQGEWRNSQTGDTISIQDGDDCEDSDKLFLTKTSQGNQTLDRTLLYADEERYSGAGMFIFSYEIGSADDSNSYNTRYDSYYVDPANSDLLIESVLGKIVEYCGDCGAVGFEFDTPPTIYERTR